MEQKILDVVSTKFFSKKMILEIELEKLINSPADNPEELANKIMSKVREFKSIVDDIQAWEMIVAQINGKLNPEMENNKQ